MKISKLEQWSIHSDELTVKTVQENNTLAIFNNTCQFVVLLTVNEKGNLLIERSSAGFELKINHENKDVFLDIW